MAEYERTLHVSADPDRVFAFVADVSNLPKYLPVMQSASAEDDGSVTVEERAPGRDETAKGHIKADAQTRRMEWGADADRHYQGWLQVAGADAGTSDSGMEADVTVHLSFAPRPQVHGELERQDGDTQRAIERQMDQALQKIKRHVEAMRA